MTARRPQQTEVIGAVKAFSFPAAGWSHWEESPLGAFSLKCSGRSCNGPPVARGKGLSTRLRAGVAPCLPLRMRALKDTMR